MARLLLIFSILLPSHVFAQEQIEIEVTYSPVDTFAVPVMSGALIVMLSVLVALAAWRLRFRAGSALSSVMLGASVTLAVLSGGGVWSAWATLAEGISKPLTNVSGGVVSFPDAGNYCLFNQTSRAQQITHIVGNTSGIQPPLEVLNDNTTAGKYLCGGEELTADDACYSDELRSGGAGPIIRPGKFCALLVDVD